MNPQCSFYDVVAGKVAQYRGVMDLPDDLPIGVQIGDVADYSAAAGHGDDGLAFTIGNDDNTEFQICVDPKLEGDPRLDHVIVHELVHVWSFSQVGDDPRANMEALTDELARWVLADVEERIPRIPPKDEIGVRIPASVQTLESAVEQPASTSGDGVANLSPGGGSDEPDTCDHEWKPTYVSGGAGYRCLKCDEEYLVSMSAPPTCHTCGKQMILYASGPIFGCPQGITSWGCPDKCP